MNTTEEENGADGSNENGKITVTIADGEVMWATTLPQHLAEGHTVVTDEGLQLIDKDGDPLPICIPVTEATTQQVAQITSGLLGAIACGINTGIVIQRIESRKQEVLSQLHEQLQEAYVRLTQQSAD